MKVATIIGARPQFIKAAMLSRAFAERSDLMIEEVLIHTGQHYDSNMSDVFFEEMGIPEPKYHLGIGGCSQGAMTGRMMESLEGIFSNEKPDWVLVYGDTNSTLAGALTAVKMHIPVAHVEAGLRSFNKKMPEEINRILTDHCSDLLFTPTKSATDRLLTEGISIDRICQIGDIMYDAALHYRKKAENSGSILETLQLHAKAYVLVTIHRAENTDDPQRLEEIFHALESIAKQCPVVLPLHPRTRAALSKIGLLEHIQKSLTVIDPVGFLEMIQLESNARLIMTDSGGVQKEAYFYRVPCLTLRTETEWNELVEHGFNQLVPLKREAIINCFNAIKERKINWDVSLYGDGSTAKAIIEKLTAFRGP